MPTSSRGADVEVERAMRYGRISVAFKNGCERAVEALSCFIQPDERGPAT